MIFDVAIVGAGVGGLSVAYECGKAGLACALIDHTTEPTYSSVANQGWLHSGSLYAYHGLSELAKECRDAHAEVVNLVLSEPASIFLAEEGIAFLSTPELADKFVKNCADCGIDTRRIEKDGLSAIGVSLAGGNYHNFPVVIPDKPISNFELLNALSRSAARSGVSFLTCDDLHSTLRGTFRNETWEIGASFGSVKARRVVVSSGVATPMVVKKLCNATVEFAVKNCYVMAFPGFPVDRLYISPNQETGGMNVAPFRGGATLNCGYYDYKIVGEYSLHIRQPLLRRAQASIEANWPELLERNPDVYTYVCQKLEIHDRDGRAARQFYLDEVSPGLFAFYPGKLTLSLLGAREFLRRSGFSRPKGGVGRSGPPSFVYRHASSQGAPLKLQSVWAL